MINKIFLAFPGYDVKVKNIEKIASIKIFNLNDISEDDFISLIHKEVRPFNKNVVRNNKQDFATQAFKNSYKNSNWGILLPVYCKEISFGEEYIACYLMKLFSGSPLSAMFSVSHAGVHISKQNVTILEKASFHGEDEKYLSKNFVSFYRNLFPVIKKAQWYAPSVARWGLEDWRLCVACSLFAGLEKYYKSRYLMTWPSECADVASLYEVLLSRRKNDGGVYRIMQRINVLFGDSFNQQMQKDFSILYNYRNEFVHGSFFERLKKNTKTYPDNNNMAQLPTMDFKFLDEQANLARKVFVIYIYLTKKMSEGYLKGASVSRVINDGIMDIKLRKKIRQCVKEILKLCN